MTKMIEEGCCVTSCDVDLSKTYWDTRYVKNELGWDLGEVSPPIARFIDTITNKSAKILIPGCGNSYEAEYLIDSGFTNVTLIDIAPTLVLNLQQKFANRSEVKIVLGDFFEHLGSYDYIIEQTFFCALPPTMRQKYVYKMHSLLNDSGILFGLLFDRSFVKSPPFGGSKEEYEKLFLGAFTALQLHTASNSIAPRANTELFIQFEKKIASRVKLYTFSGLTCSGCVNTVSDKVRSLNGINNVSISTDFSEMLIVSDDIVPVDKLQELVAYDAKYKIEELI